MLLMVLMVLLLLLVVEVVVLVHHPVVRRANVGEGASAAVAAGVGTRRVYAMRHHFELQWGGGGRRDSSSVLAVKAFIALASTTISLAPHPAQAPPSSRPLLLLRQVLPPLSRLLHAALDYLTG